MSCYHPNKMFVVGETSEGKQKLVFTSGVECWAVSSKDPKSNHWTKWYEDKVSSTDVDLSQLERYNDWLYIDRREKGYPIWWSFEYIEVPCGQCKGCRIDRSRDWATRMSLEARDYEDNCFVTLTYDDAHVPTATFVATGGDSLTSLTLRKRDFQLFMKNLRIALSRKGDEPIRFYACGEYGSRTYRPHYHAILFNYWPEDAVLDHVSPDGHAFYTSETISKAWKHQGFILVSRVSWETCAYTARYVTKKLNGDGAGLYSHMNIEPPFSLMSRRPGIARRYYEEHKRDIYRLGMISQIYIPQIDGAMKVKPPRYYDKLFDIEYPEESEQIRQARQRLARASLANRLRKTSLNKWKLLSCQEAHFECKIKTLKRDAV